MITIPTNIVWSDEELKELAKKKCVGIYQNMSEAEAMASKWFIRQAWNLGKAIMAKNEESKEHCVLKIEYCF